MRPDGATLCMGHLGGCDRGWVLLPEQRLPSLRRSKRLLRPPGRAKQQAGLPGRNPASIYCEDKKCQLGPLGQETKRKCIGITIRNFFLSKAFTHNCFQFHSRCQFAHSCFKKFSSRTTGTNCCCLAVVIRRSGESRNASMIIAPSRSVRYMGIPRKS